MKIHVLQIVMVKVEALNNLNEEDLLRNVYIRGESHLVLDAIERQLAHYVYHIGQNRIYW